MGDGDSGNFITEGLLDVVFMKPFSAIENMNWDGQKVTPFKSLRWP